MIARTLSHTLATAAGIAAAAFVYQWLTIGWS